MTKQNITHPPLTHSNSEKMNVHLNAILANELVAINQYFLHSKMLADWGFMKLAAKEKAASIDEMKHADILADRILFLKGSPDFQHLGKLHTGKTVPAMLENDLKLEFHAHKALIKAINFAKEISDIGSKNLLEKILINEEEHIDWLNTQLDLITKLGEKNYLQLQV